MSRSLGQPAGTTRVMLQGIKDQASKCDSTVKSFKDTSTYGSSSEQVSKFSGSVNATAVKTANQFKQTEDSLRRVMYLSCWCPN